MVNDDDLRKRLLQLVDYDPSTGNLYWKVRCSICDASNWQSSFNVRNAGKRVGTLTDKGYLVAGIDGSRYRVHKLVWLIENGCMPVSDIDHINGDKTDNRIGNLRCVSNSVNRQNIRKAYKKKSNLPLGVYLNKKGGPRPYVASVRLNGVSIHVGCFSTAEEAHSAYVDKKREMHIGCSL